MIKGRFKASVFVFLKDSVFCPFGDYLLVDSPVLVIWILSTWPWPSSAPWMIWPLLIPHSTIDSAEVLVWLAFNSIQVICCAPFPREASVWKLTSRSLHSFWAQSTLLRNQHWLSELLSRADHTVQLRLPWGISTPNMYWAFSKPTSS